MAGDRTATPLSTSGTLEVGNGSEATRSNPLTEFETTAGQGGEEAAVREDGPSAKSGTPADFANGGKTKRLDTGGPQHALTAEGWGPSIPCQPRGTGGE